MSRKSGGFFSSPLDAAIERARSDYEFQANAFREKSLGEAAQAASKTESYAALSKLLNAGSNLGRGAGLLGSFIETVNIAQAYSEGNYDEAGRLTTGAVISAIAGAAAGAAATAVGTFVGGVAAPALAVAGFVGFAVYSADYLE